MIHSFFFVWLKVHLKMARAKLIHQKVHVKLVQGLYFLNGRFKYFDFFQAPKS